MKVLLWLLAAVVLSIPAAAPVAAAFGERFLEQGHRMPAEFASRRTFPFAVWGSARSDVLPG